jgi:calcyphosin
MDWINKFHIIIERMKSQLHAKQIDSLDGVYMAISKYDTENKGYVDKIDFENFLSKLGIFLKTQVRQLLLINIYYL